MFLSAFAKWRTNVEISEPITELIERVREGDQEARTKLWDIVMPILRGRAEKMLQADRVGGLMRPSDLLQDAFLQLIAKEKIGWKDRQHLFRFAARVMRNLVTDQARRHLREDRRFAAVSESMEIEVNDDVSWVEVDEILGQLEAIDPDKAAVVELRAYGGLTNEEIAEHLEISVSTVKRHIDFARAFIMSRIRPAKDA